MKNRLVRIVRRIALCFAIAVTFVVSRAWSATLTFNGPGYIGDARAIAFAPDGDIWVGGGGLVAVFGPDGVYKRNESDSFTGGQVNSIVFDAQGHPFYAINGGGIISRQGDKTISMQGFGRYSPWEIALDAAGDIYAPDGGNSNIAKFNIQGTRLQTIVGPDVGAPDAMDRPYSIAFDAKQRFFVSDENKPGLWIFTHEGKYIARIQSDTRFYRLRRVGPDIYAVTDQGIAVLDPVSGTITRVIHIPWAGQAGAMGFAVDAQGNIYLGNHDGGAVMKTDPYGTQLQMIGQDYVATLTIPGAWTAGTAQDVGLKIDHVATKPSGPNNPDFTSIVQSAVLSGDPDVDFVNGEGGHPDPAWQARRDAIFAAKAHQVTLTKSADGYTAVVPAGVSTDLYNMEWSVAGAGDSASSQQTPISVVRPGAHSSLTLFVPRHRSVFQQGEQIEINAIVRSSTALPAGSLRFSLVKRSGDSLAFDDSAPVWKQFSIDASGSQTLTFDIDAGGIHPGRYLLQAELNGTGMRDVWPVQIVAPIQTTRFRILFPEWSAGYTHIWGPFQGDGMQADSAKLASEGIELYDTLMVGRGTDPPMNPDGNGSAVAEQEIQRATVDTALPAPEKFIAPSPLEIELQEALRNNMTVQRDIWGSHFLENWGIGVPLAIQRDNRGVQLWTQWQREWPSWVGHRYLSLSLDEGQNPDRVALENDFTASTGMKVPTEDELRWVRNGEQRQLIANSPTGNIGSEYSSIGTDAAGNIFVCSRSGVLVKCTPDGKIVSTVNINAGETIDEAVAPNGTVYIAHMGGTVTTVTPDGKVSHWYDARFSSHSPRGICLAPDGTLLCTDMDKQVIYRYTTAGQYLTSIGSNQNLKLPEGITTGKDGTIYVLEGGNPSGVMVFKADGTPDHLIQGAGSHIFGGKGDVAVDKDGTLWVTEGWGAIRNVSLDGKQLAYIGRATFAPGGIAEPTAVALTPDGNILEADVALPWAQEFTRTGDLVRLIGFGNIFADVRVDRTRYVATDHILATVWYPVQGYPGDPDAVLQVFASPTGVTSPRWIPVKASGFGGGEYFVAMPPLGGNVTLRLVLDKPGATADDPLHADLQIAIDASTFPADQIKANDIFRRQQAWTTYWAKHRMGTLVRWTQLSDKIRPGTQDTAPTNYGTPDDMAEGVYIPFRRDAVVAEAENEGHDHGTFPMMGPWYVARALEGPDPKPAWSSELRWFWETIDNGVHKDVARRPRPERDYTLLLGAGASGIGTGTPAFLLPPEALKTHRKMVDRLQRIGEATMGLDLPGKGGVAVLHSFTQEVMDPYMQEQFYAAHAAWYDLVRAHVPVAVVSEEAIAHDDLIGRFKAVLLPYIQFPLPQTTMAGLERFRASGGEIWLDLNSRITVPGRHTLETKYRPYWAQDAYFSIRSGIGVDGYDGNWEYWRMKQGSDNRLAALRKAFGKLITNPVETDDPNVFVMQRKGGAAVYEFVGNDHFPDKPLIETSLTSDAPIPATVSFTAHGSAIYDAYEMKRVDAGSMSVDFTDDDPARVWVSLPSPIASVSLSAARVGDHISGTIGVLGSSGARIPAIIPLELHITDASGATQYHIFRATDVTGKFVFALPVHWMAPCGAWKVSARELLSGKNANPVTVTVVDEPPTTIARDPSKALVYDRPAIAAWLPAMKGQDVWIAVGSDRDPAKPLATQLAQALTQYGIRASVVSEKDIPEEHIDLEFDMSADDQAKLRRIKSGVSIGIRDSPGGHNDFMTVGPKRMIMKPLILMGSPKDNPWLADIENEKINRRQLSPLYPGPGRALVQYAWTPFWDGFDAVTVESNDQAGLREGVNALLGH